MARAGILYSDVAKAASQLAENGKTPTVDTVREAIGSTGSKSTIAPMLKRWKQEHVEAVEASGSGIPSGLLQAVKNVYEAVQAEADSKIVKALKQHQMDLAALRQHEQELLNEKSEIVDQNKSLQRDLTNAQREIAQLKAEKQALSLSLATLEVDKSGLQLRLMDRTSEVASLTQQLTHARAQFDHYQEATAVQRAQDRTAYELRITRLDQDITGARQSLLANRSTMAQQEAQLTQLQKDQQRAEALGISLADDLTVIRSERDILKYQCTDLSGSNDILMKKMELMSKQQLESHVQSATQGSELQLLKGQLEQAVDKLGYLDTERMSLVTRLATLQANTQSPNKMP
ncbi:hypothetical protein BH11PSE12_BH11PSE12_26930 [soil metagenome]